ncbi:MAG: hypothetical protein WKG07_20720 [Hymenobacter sp.]
MTLIDFSDLNSPVTKYATIARVRPAGFGILLRLLAPHLQCRGYGAGGHGRAHGGRRHGSSCQQGAAVGY